MTTLNKHPQIKTPGLQFLLQHPAHFFGLGLGSGLAPKAPGTFGTLVGLPLFWLISVYPLITQLIVITALFLTGIYFCHITGKALGVTDHGGIVWDEIVAMMLVLAFTPNEWQWWLTAFLLLVVNIKNSVSLIINQKYNSTLYKIPIDTKYSILHLCDTILYMYLLCKCMYPSNYSTCKLKYQPYNIIYYPPFFFLLSACI